MFTLNRWNPIDELTTLHREMDRIFARQWNETRQPERAWAPPVEVVLQKDAWKVLVALPGIEPSEVRIDVHGNTLTIGGTRPAPKYDNDSYQTEFAYGPFERTFTLPSAIDKGKVTASYHHGMLELVLPVAESEKPRRVEITTGQLRDIDVRKLA